MNSITRSVSNDNEAWLGVAVPAGGLPRPRERAGDPQARHSCLFFILYEKIFVRRKIFLLTWFAC